MIPRLRRFKGGAGGYLFPDMSAVLVVYLFVFLLPATCNWMDVSLPMALAALAHPAAVPVGASISPWAVSPVLESSPPTAVRAAFLTAAAAQAEELRFISGPTISLEPSRRMVARARSLAGLEPSTPKRIALQTGPLPLTMAACRAQTRSWMFLHSRKSTFSAVLRSHQPFRASTLTAWSLPRMQTGCFRPAFF